MRFGQTTIRNKVIYGAGAFLINRPYPQLCDEMPRCGGKSWRTGCGETPLIYSSTTSETQLSAADLNGFDHQQQRSQDQVGAQRDHAESGAR